MIDVCPCHGRSVSSDEWLTRTSVGCWVPTSCASGDGPTCTSGQELVRNHPYWYVSIVDRDRRAMLLGPYADYDAAKNNLAAGKRLAIDSSDPDSPFYGYGISSSSIKIKTVFGK